MSDEIMLVFGEDGVAREYDDTWDITIHCESEEEQKAVLEKLNNSNQEAKNSSDLIERQDAIEVIEEMQMPIMRSMFPEEQFVFKGMSEALSAIKDLPSAQPESEERKAESAQNVPKEDLISRKAAIDARGKAQWAKERLMELPSVQPEPQWIPVSERVPEELEAVIITWKNHEPEPYYSDIKHKPFIGVGIYHREKWWWWSAYAEDMLAEYGDSIADRMDEAIEVTAWMPLPEPARLEND